MFSTGVVKTVFQKPRRAPLGHSPSITLSYLQFFFDFEEILLIGVFITATDLCRGTHGGEIVGKISLFE